MSHLVSYKSQIEPNLRRTASKGLISLLNQQQLEQLAFKYFGIKDEYENIIGYQCPYSGKIYNDYKDIVLEHIVPVVSKGGTVLFNCIPTSKEVNGSNQKGAKHLITWWIKSKYWNKEAPLRLEKIVNYMLDAYDQVFTEYTIEEVESSYLDIETDESNLEEEDNLEYSEANESKLLKQAKNNGIHSYLGFILDCINTLENKEICNIDTTDIRRKLKELQENHIFEDIERYQLFQNIIQKLIISRIGDDNHSYLTYSLNFDIKKLMDSIKSNNPEEIYNELNSRLQNIEQLLKENNLSTIEYFKSLKDIPDIDIIYLNISNISENELQIFLENIKIGIDTKIEIFIEMLNNGNNDILKTGNNVMLDGYPGISLAYFWQTYKDKIQTILFEEWKDKSEYKKARQTILDKYKVRSYEELISKQKLTIEKAITIYIDMLNKGNSNILTKGNKTTLDGYPSVSLASFWKKHKTKIQRILFEEWKDKPEYETARQIILNKYKVRSYEELISKQKLTTEKAIKIYIEMLNKGNNNILKNGNNVTLDGYPSVSLAQFWSNYKIRIQTILFENLKDDSTYDKARQTILAYFGVGSYEELMGKKIQIQYEIPLEEKIKIYIEMLNKGNSNILTKGNNITLDGYPNVSLAHFWNSHNDRIQAILFEEWKDKSEYEMARQIILNKYKVRSYEELISKQKLTTEKAIKIYIEMLNKGNSDILTRRNKITLDGHPSVKLAYFWANHKDEIKTLLFETLKDNSDYDNARQTILTYFKVESYKDLIDESKKKKTQYDLELEDKIEIFIDMLNHRNSNILEHDNKLFLDGYPSVKLAQFWNNHQDKIKSILFEQLKDNPNYDNARQTILTYFKVGSYEELEFIKLSNLHLRITSFIKMLNSGNKEILKSRNNEFFEGYSNTKVGTFWHLSKNRKIIIKTLFEKLIKDKSYDTARNLILENLKVKNIDEYYEKKESVSKQLKEDKKIKQELEETIKYLDEVDLTEQEQRQRA